MDKTKRSTNTRNGKLAAIKNQHHSRSLFETFGVTNAGQDIVTNKPGTYGSQGKISKRSGKLESMKKLLAKSKKSDNTEDYVVDKIQMFKARRAMASPQYSKCVNDKIIKAKMSKAAKLKTMKDKLCKAGITTRKCDKSILNNDQLLFSPFISMDSLSGDWGPVKYQFGNSHTTNIYTRNSTSIKPSKSDTNFDKEKHHMKRNEEKTSSANKHQRSKSGSAPKEQNMQSSQDKTKRTRSSERQKEDIKQSVKVNSKTTHSSFNVLNKTKDDEILFKKPMVPPLKCKRSRSEDKKGKHTVSEMPVLAPEPQFVDLTREEDRHRKIDNNNKEDDENDDMPVLKANRKRKKISELLKEADQKLNAVNSTKQQSTVTENLPNRDLYSIKSMQSNSPMHNTSSQGIVTNTKLVIKLSKAGISSEKCDKTIMQDSRLPFSPFINIDDVSTNPYLIAKYSTGFQPIGRKYNDSCKQKTKNSKRSDSESKCAKKSRSHTVTTTPPKRNVLKPSESRFIKPIPTSNLSGHSQKNTTLSNEYLCTISENVKNKRSSASESPKKSHNNKSKVSESPKKSHNNKSKVKSPDKPKSRKRKEKQITEMNEEYVPLCKGSQIPEDNTLFEPPAKILCPDKNTPIKVLQHNYRDSYSKKGVKGNDEQKRSRSKHKFTTMPDKNNEIMEKLSSKGIEPSKCEAQVLKDNRLLLSPTIELNRMSFSFRSPNKSPKFSYQNKRKRVYLSSSSENYRENQEREISAEKCLKSPAEKDQPNMFNQSDQTYNSNGKMLSPLSLMENNMSPSRFSLPSPWNCKQLQYIKYRHMKRIYKQRMAQNNTDSQSVSATDNHLNEMTAKVTQKECETDNQSDEILHTEKGKVSAKSSKKGNILKKQRPKKAKKTPTKGYKNKSENNKSSSVKNKRKAQTPRHIQMLPDGLTPDPSVGTPPNYYMSKCPSSIHISEAYNENEMKSSDMPKYLGVHTDKSVNVSKKQLKDSVNTEEVNTKVDTENKPQASIPRAFSPRKIDTIVAKLKDRCKYLPKTFKTNDPEIIRIFSPSRTPSGKTPSLNNEHDSQGQGSYRNLETPFTQQWMTENIVLEYKHGSSPQSENGSEIHRRDATGKKLNSEKAVYIESIHRPPTDLHYCEILVPPSASGSHVSAGYFTDGEQQQYSQILSKRYSSVHSPVYNFLSPPDSYKNSSSQISENTQQTPDSYKNSSPQISENTQQTADSYKNSSSQISENTQLTSGGTNTENSDVESISTAECSSLFHSPPGRVIGKHMHTSSDNRSSNYGSVNSPQDFYADGSSHVPSSRESSLFSPRSVQSSWASQEENEGFQSQESYDNNEIEENPNSSDTQSNVIQTRIPLSSPQPSTIGTPGHFVEILCQTDKEIPNVGTIFLQDESEIVVLGPDAAIIAYEDESDVENNDNGDMRENDATEEQNDTPTSVNHESDKSNEHINMVSEGSTTLNTKGPQDLEFVEIAIENNTPSCTPRTISAFSDNGEATPTYLQPSDDEISFNKLNKDQKYRIMKWRKESLLEMKANKIEDSEQTELDSNEQNQNQKCFTTGAKKKKPKSTRSSSHVHTAKCYPHKQETKPKRRKTLKKETKIKRPRGRPRKNHIIQENELSQEQQNSNNHQNMEVNNNYKSAFQESSDGNDNALNDNERRDDAQSNTMNSTTDITTNSIQDHPVHCPTIEELANSMPPMETSFLDQDSGLLSILHDNIMNSLSADPTQDSSTKQDILDIAMTLADSNINQNSVPIQTKGQKSIGKGKLNADSCYLSPVSQKDQMFLSPNPENAAIIVQGKGFKGGKGAYNLGQQYENQSISLNSKSITHPSPQIYPTVPFGNTNIYNDDSSSNYSTTDESANSTPSYPQDNSRYKFPFENQLMQRLNTLQRRQLSTGALFGCDVCGECFKTETDKATHLMTHRSGFSSSILGLQSRSTNSERCQSAGPFQNAGQYGHAPGKFVCTECNVSFRDKTSLDFHIRGHHPNMFTFSCDVCNHKFNDKMTLLQHKQTHGHLDMGPANAIDSMPQTSATSDVNPVVCPFCQKSFLQLTHLRDHMVTHMSGLFVCEYCKKTYNSQSHLNRHVQKRHMAEPVTCAQCNKLFQSKKYLRRHFKNGECQPNKFDKKNNANDSSDDEMDVMLTCGKCRKRFYGEAQFRFHFCEPKVKFMCNVCLAIFDSDEQLKRHEATH